MGLFEFLMILLSVVTGLALGERLTGLAQRLHGRDDSRSPGYLADHAGDLGRLSLSVSA